MARRKPLQVAPEPGWVANIVIQAQAWPILPGDRDCTPGPQLYHTAGDSAINNTASTQPARCVTL